MKRIVSFFSILLTVISAYGFKYDFSFKSIPLSRAIIEICRNCPELNVSFLYNDLNNYIITRSIKTDDAETALRTLIGSNPVSLIVKGNEFFIEALQHGKFTFSGLIENEDNIPLHAATIILLNPKDSTYITFGITDENGCYNIPCDRKTALAKISCVSYRTKYYNLHSNNNDTIKLSLQPINLQSVNIETKNIMLGNDKTTYIPSLRQKNASQTAVELLARISSPQLMVNMVTGKVESFSQRPVSLFIDFLPATSEELTGMSIQDVKKIEIYENPMDPRFGKSEFVVNFIMQQYEYGGYTKLYASKQMINTSTLGQLNTRMQYKSMQYDLMASAYSSSSDHEKLFKSETFRLLQPEGDILTVEHSSMPTESRYIIRNYSTAFKATYKADILTASSSITCNLRQVPHNDVSSDIIYSPNSSIPSITSISESNSKSFHINYSGAYYLDMKKNGTLNFTPSFTHSHTKQGASYREEGMSSYHNNALDNSNDIKGVLTYQPSFLRYGTLTTNIAASHISSRTRYAGTAEGSDISRITDFSTDLKYSLSADNLNLFLGFGWKWMWLSVNEVSDIQNKPNLDLSMNYIIKRKHNIRMYGSYSPMPPMLIYRSDKIVQSSPFFYYTGNPALKATDWYNGGLGYTFIPGGIFYFGYNSKFL